MSKDINYYYEHYLSRDPDNLHTPPLTVGRAHPATRAIARNHLNHLGTCKTSKVIIENIIEKKIGLFRHINTFQVGFIDVFYTY